MAWGCSSWMKVDELERVGVLEEVEVAWPDRGEQSAMISAAFSLPSALASISSA